MVDPLATAEAVTDAIDDTTILTQRQQQQQQQQQKRREPLRIGLLGCGAINSTVARMIVNHQAGPAVLKSILVRTERSRDDLRSMMIDIDPETPDGNDDDGNDDNDNDNDDDNDDDEPYTYRYTCTTDADRFFSGNDWSLCIEAAGQQAVRDYGKRCLASGRDLMITSIGALTDDDLYHELRTTAEANGSRLILCTGSMPALDWMGAASLDDCEEVTITQIKPPGAWLGTPAEADHPDLLELSEARVLFEGSSRGAASLFPKNANVAAMLALATVGLDRTSARLVADPHVSGNRVELSIRGAAGSMKVDVEAAPSRTNPRTSAIVALSVVKAIRKLSCPVVVGL